MRNRSFLVFDGVRLFLISLGIVALAAPAATAVLKKYEVRKTQLRHFENLSPHVEYRTWGAEGVGTAVIDESGANPVLKKLISIEDRSSTTSIPILPPVFIWYSKKIVSGPGGDEIGTGSTSSSIAWGNVTGWTITGGTFCYATVSYICSLALAIHNATVDTVLSSDNYDIGTWTFHGTGFSATPFVHETGTAGLGVGNLQWLLRGAEVADGTVSALPLLGLGAVGVSVLAMGIASLRRYRE